MAEASESGEAQEGADREPEPDNLEPPGRLIDEFLPDRGATRERWKEKGFEALAVYTTDYFANLHGGLDRGSVVLGNLDLLFALDAERAFGWTGTIFFVYFLWDHGANPSDLVGDVQYLDNIAAPPTFKLYEMLGEVRLAPQFSLLAGLYDVNSEFDLINSSQDFINSSFGIGPDFSQSGRNGPSIFPVTSLGVRAKFQPSLSFYLQMGVLDGVPGDPHDPDGTQIIIKNDDGALFVAEGGWILDAAKDHPPEARRLRARRIGRQQDWGQRGKVALGGWNYSRSQPTIDSDPMNPQSARSWGAYLLGEMRVIGEPGEYEQGLDLFGRIGVADSEVNRFGSSVTIGASYTGAFPRRDEDGIGLAIATAFNGDEYRAALSGAGIPVDDAEIAIELTYVAKVRPWLRVQPDLQYIINPGTDPQLDNALALGLRLGITF